MSEQRKVLLSLKNVSVKFNVRGRILTAIRNVSLDIYEHESIAIVGESGSGKSVLTKTFAGMLDSNGFISEGSIIFADDDLSHTNIKLTPANLRLLERLSRKYNRYSVPERGAEEYRAIRQKQADIKHVKALSEEEEENFRVRFKAVQDDLTDTNNYLLTLDKHRKAHEEEIKKAEEKIRELTARENALNEEKKALIKERTEAYKHDTAKQQADRNEIARLKALRKEKIKTVQNKNNPYGLSDEIISRNRNFPLCCMATSGEVILLPDRMGMPG